ncbi:hypothetical protein M430DRAFT_18729 [Amorphotheca resinae ATCC 22711]|uniref:Uncharacterized protein n=1 Tax=Amorphotheca resinae ATCC 22711 TaxID=857342 RepID=A0A2T3B4N1_AMORE|nr:hypothetical protein M430DRAFT_18729 [Amorphotheca resinae ATCC 22711]PSS20578.1 hypothetical protein M430DRAFT_18729 [Amorphotheca resinae ATCC 22711]
MAESAEPLEYLDYLASFMDSDIPPRISWSKLEERFNRRVAKYRERWPECDENRIKYCALHQTCTKLWNPKPPFPTMDRFSFKNNDWPRDAVTEPEASSSLTMNTEQAEAVGKGKDGKAKLVPKPNFKTFSAGLAEDANATQVSGSGSGSGRGQVSGEAEGAAAPPIGEASGSGQGNPLGDA